LIEILSLLLFVAGLASPPVVAGEIPRRQIGQVILEGVPEWDESLRTRMLQYLQTRSATLQGVADDGTYVLISTRFGDTMQLHVVRHALGMRRQITFFDEPIRGASFVPATDGRQIIFSSDIGGSEFNQIYLLDLGGGRYVRLTDGRSRNDSPVVSRDGRWLAFCSTARNGRDFDIYRVDLTALRAGDALASGNAPAPDDPAAPQRIWEVEGAYYPAEFSPDSSQLLVEHYVSARETYWYRLDVATGRTEALTPADPPAYYGGGAWSADGTAVYFTSDREGEFRRLYRYTLATREWTCLTPDIDWDVSAVAVDPASGGIAFVTNEDGLSRLYFADADGGSRRAVRNLPAGIVYGLQFAVRGGVLGLTLTTPISPGDAYTISYPDGRVTRWTQSEIGGLRPESFTKPALIRYPTFDKVDGKPRMIPAFYYRAPQPGRRPVLIYVHGGPESQYRPAFSSVIQFVVNELGISVIAPNVRGSTGYGRTYHQLDNGVRREDSVRDIGALLDWIATRPELDPQRVGILGGSYGGYMVLASLVNYPGRIRAGIDVVGITDFITFLKNTQDYRRDLRRAEYGDERDPEVRRVLERISPLRNAEKITAALFVLHGANDPRVPLSEAEQLVAKMREMGRPVWFFKALDEGHGFRKRPNRDLARILYVHFLQLHLLK